MKETCPGCCRLTIIPMDYSSRTKEWWHHIHWLALSIYLSCSIQGQIPSPSCLIIRHRGSNYICMVSQTPALKRSPSPIHAIYFRLYRRLVCLPSKSSRERTSKSNMLSLHALYSNFKNDISDLLEVPDFSIATWLAFGAGLQLLSQSWLPSGLTYWLPLCYLLYRVVRVSIDCRRIYSGAFTDVMSGRWSATLPEPEDLSAVTATSDGVVMFLLGARINQFVPLFHAVKGSVKVAILSNMPQSSGQACPR